LLQEGEIGYASQLCEHSLGLEMPLAVNLQELGKEREIQGRRFWDFNEDEKRTHAAHGYTKGHSCVSEDLSARFGEWRSD
jgi:hypothetical protein